MAMDSGCVERSLRKIFLVAAVVMIAGLFYLGGKPVAVGLFPPAMDKVAHFVTFGLIAVLLSFSMPKPKPWLVVMFVAGIGAADEIHQLYLPGRSASLNDFVVDALAAIFVVIVLECARRYR